MGYPTQLQGKLYSKVNDPQPEFNTEVPPHAALIHFPIAFNILAWGLDILYALTTTYVRPTFLTSRFDNPETLLDITRLSYFLLSAGLITTVPAIMSGMQQLSGLIGKNGGPWEKDAAGKPKSTIVPRIKFAIGHAFINDAIFLANLYSWWIRRGTEANGWNPGKTPSTVNLAISAVLFPLLLAGSKAGASLVYNHGVGLHLGRKKWPETNNMTDARGNPVAY
ncbi:hypothetical protein DV736_g639, partial [Chaetothyriales sp. CBS 134916]